MSTVPPSRTLAQRLSGAFFTFGALVAGASFVAAVTHGVNIAWLTPELESGHIALQNEGAALAAMLDQEDGLRGYLLTRDVHFLEAVVGGEAALARANSILSSHAGSAPSAELAVAMVKTRLSEERWHERWAKSAADTRQGALPPSLSDGEALFDEYRSAQAGFAEQLRQRRDRLSERQQTIISGQVALELVVFLAGLSLVVLQYRALRAAIVDPVAALLCQVRLIRDGQLEVTARLTGPRELVELGQGLNEVVGALIAARECAASRDGALSEHAIRLHRIMDASREFSESLNLGHVVKSVCESTAAIGGYERVLVWLMDDDQKQLAMSGESVSGGASGASLDDSHGPAARATKSGRVTFEGPAGQVRFSDSGTMPVRAIAMPLIVGARVVGVLEARLGQASQATREMIEVLEMLATHAATAIESARLYEVTEERSELDPLTRLLNRRRLDEDLDAECERCIRYGRPLAFVMLDVDHFKEFNDTHGHPQADTALQQVADVIASCVRSTDTAYRYGGEEFCILLRETCAQDALHFAERVRQRIENRFASGDMQGITASFGVADFSPDAPAPRALVEAADAAMYESKHAGRNRVAVSVRPAASHGTNSVQFSP